MRCEMQDSAPHARSARTTRVSRVIGVALTCAMAWGGTGRLYVVDLPDDACCAKSHDARRCACRRCAHSRDTTHCFFEQCSESTSGTTVFALDVFGPAQWFRPEPWVRRSQPSTSSPQSPPERAIEVPTPPP